MNVLKKILGVIIMATMIFGAAGCSNSNNTVGYQLEMPKSGEEIAVMTTNMGTIKMRFFPKAAPKAVENFKTHSRDGYYNGLTFHRIIENFMVQGGDPQGDGTGGESIWGEPFEDEFNEYLFNIKGAVAMANSGPNTNGSQFFINQAGADSFNGWDYYQQIYDIYSSNPTVFTSRYGGTVDMSKITDEIKELYKQNGGNPNLDGAYSTNGRGHTVFAQVFEGMDVVDSMAAVDVNSSDKPINPVVIEKVEIVKY